MHTTPRLLSTFARKTFRGSHYDSTLAGRYRRQLDKHPFLLFGLPFILTMVAGSFFLTPAQALRYETYDRKVQRVTQDEVMSATSKKRKVFDMNEEYYKLAAKDLDNWEQKRAERLPGEPENMWEKPKE